MEEHRMRVGCPQCGSTYRVDADALPPEGATAVCKKCGRRFGIQKPGPESAGGNAPVPPLAAEPSRESAFTCPRCGHRQNQPYNCYVCGAVITPKEPPSAAPAVGDSTSGKPEVKSSLLPAMCEIVVRTRLEKSDWLLNFVKPRVSVDGMEHHQGWGAHAIQVLEGDCLVVVDYKYFIKYRGRGALKVHASAAEKVFIDYHPGASSAGSIRTATSVEGLLWPIQTESSRPAAKGLYTRKAVIISLIVLGPIGLYQLWKSEAFSNKAKIAISAGVAILAYWLFSKISVPGGSLLMR